MKKTLKLSLVKAIIKSDFFIVNKVNALPKNNKYKLHYKNKMLFSLNIQSLCLEIKSMSRMFRHYFKRLPNKSKFLINSKEDFHFLIENFIKNYYLLNYIYYSNYTTKNLDQNTKSVLFLNDVSNLEKLKKKFIQQQILFVTIFDLNQNNYRINSSFFFIKNTIDNNKKLLFILALLEHTIKQNKNL